MKKLFPFAVFLSVALASLIMAGYAYRASQNAGHIKFEAAADDALARIESRINLHLSLLRATHAFIEARRGSVSRDEFATFVDGLNLDTTYTGLRGIGILMPARRGDDAMIASIIERGYGLERTIQPPSQSDLRTPIVMFEPANDGSLAALGYDMYSDPARRPAIEAAMQASGAHATGYVELGRTTGGPTFAGFLVFLRYEADAKPNGDPAGLLYATFRATELFGAALGRAPLLPVNVEVYEGDPAEGKLLFRSQAKPSPRLEKTHLLSRELLVAGKLWTVLMRPTSAFVEPSSPLIPISLGLAGLFLALAIAMLAHWQARAYAAVENLQSTTEKSLVEREMMLQEMKHRIKNSLTRVLAMARHTASNSKDIEEFSKSFSARIQAMAASQDMLTRSRWQKADLEELLRTELEQVFGRNLKAELLSGPAVEIDEVTTQALGLTFHELATNALKYGNASQDGKLEVCWQVKKSPPTLELTWKESGQGLTEPTHSGFGTKLIDMSICRELGGEITREFGEHGLSVRISIPLDSRKRRSGGH